MARVIWEREALDHLDQIIDHISQFDPDAALRVGVRLVALGDSLTDYPHRGRPASASRREMTIVPPYILSYQVVDDTVLILSIRHGARRPLDQGQS